MKVRSWYYKRKHKACYDPKCPRYVAGASHNFKTELCKYAK